MPRQVPTFADYFAANPYSGSRWRAWRAGAEQPLDAPVPEFETQGELESFTEGVAWRMEWEKQNNPLTISATPGADLEEIEQRASTAQLYNLPVFTTNTGRASSQPQKQEYPQVQVTPAPKAEEIGRWHDERQLTLFTHSNGKQQVVVGDLGRVVEVIKAGVILKNKDTVLHIMDSFVIATEPLESFSRASGGLYQATKLIEEGPTTTAHAHGDWFKVPKTTEREETPKPDGLPPNHKSVLSTKTYGHDLGFSCAFRQHRAQSHCRFIHGYALGFKFTFAADTLSHEGWVVDFGGLKSLKALLEDTFDHKLLVAEDDPDRDELSRLSGYLADVVIVPATGCEAFARMVYDVTEQWLQDAGFSPRVRLVSVEVSEHGANSAIAQG